VVAGRSLNPPSKKEKKNFLFWLGLFPDARTYQAGGRSSFEGSFFFSGRFFCPSEDDGVLAFPPRMDIFLDRKCALPFFFPMSELCEVGDRRGPPVDDQFFFPFPGEQGVPFFFLPFPRG